MDGRSRKLASNAPSSIRTTVPQEQSNLESRFELETQIPNFGPPLLGPPHPGVIKQCPGRMVLGDSKMIAFGPDLDRAVLREGFSFKRLKKGRLSVAEVEAIGKVGRNSCADERAQGPKLPMTTTVNAEDVCGSVKPGIATR